MWVAHYTFIRRLNYLTNINASSAILQKVKLIIILLLRFWDRGKLELRRCAKADSLRLRLSCVCLFLARCECLLMEPALPCATSLNEMPLVLIVSRLAGCYSWSVNMRWCEKNLIWSECSNSTVCRVTTTFLLRSDHSLVVSGVKFWSVCGEKRSDVHRHNRYRRSSIKQKLDVFFVANDFCGCWCSSVCHWELSEVLTCLLLWGLFLN